MEEIIEEEPAVQDDVQDVLGSARDAEEEPSVGEQSVLALQQLAVVVGVALLVGSCFMLMIGLELGLSWLEDRCSSFCGGRKKSQEEVVDPAALVGSFKRYK